METAGTFVSTEKDMVDYPDNGAVGLHRVAANGTILRANRADYESLGYTREEHVGHHIAEFHADPDVLNDMSPGRPVAPAGTGVQGGGVAPAVTSSCARGRARRQPIAAGGRYT